MSTACVCETGASTHVYEHEVARRWFALPPGVLLPLSNGDTCQLVFAGCPGSAVGPDVRDAVLRFSHHAMQCVGDVEFHVRASDWFTHLHSTDARYNGVLLHVVLVCDNISPALRQDGTTIPMCSLYDLALPHMQQITASWPCHTVMQHMSDEERSFLLRQAGELRFEQKVHAFVEQLHNASPRGPFSAFDVCLVMALAEGLGYGRDRAFFRAAGEYLLGLSNEVPEPLGRTVDPPPLDASRLSVLRKLVEQWRTGGAWSALRGAIALAPTRGATTFHFQWHDTMKCSGIPCGNPVWGTGNQAGLYALRAIFAGLGTARADILICNVVLPFALAVALLENDSDLAERARMLYVEHPGLSSNRVTRAMCQQLQLKHEPKGACQQQGLHYIYQQTCREKQCEWCIVGRRKI